jgi:hypothetical protein
VQSSSAPPLPLMRIMTGNAFLLSILYLLVGLGTEVAWRVRPTVFLQRLSLSLDALPARVLEWLRLLGPLREAYFTERLPAGALRVVFGATTVAIIYVLALVVGLVMGTLRGLLLQRQRRR